MIEPIIINKTTLSVKKILHNTITHVNHNLQLSRKNTRFTKGQTLFLEVAVRILLETHERFNFKTYMQYSHISHDSFRQYVKQLRPYLDITRSKPRFYSLKNIILPHDYLGNITLDRMEVGKKIDDLLQSLESQPAKIHDIRLKFDSNIHSFLLNLPTREVNEKNNQFIQDISEHIGNPHITVKLQISPKNVQVIIGCTSRPIVYDLFGVNDLSAILGKISGILTALSGFDPKLELPPTNLWVLTHYHFGRDSIEEFSGDMFHYTFDNFKDGLIRYYSKRLHGKTTVRVEQIQTPKFSMREMLVKIMDQGGIQKT